MPAEDTDWNLEYSLVVIPMNSMLPNQPNLPLITNVREVEVCSLTLPSRTMKKKFLWEGWREISVRLGRWRCEV